MIDTLTITNFRNHAASRIKAAGFKNIIITGPNGSGKTAILESVSVMSAGTPMRGGSVSDIAKFGTGGFGVVADMSDGGNISVSWKAGDAYRRAILDGDAAPLSDLSGVVRIIWVTPKEDRLFIESVADRRAFLDRMVASFDVAHSGRVARLSKLLSERAFALKKGADNNWLCPIEQSLAETATAIAAARVKYAAEINYFLNIACDICRHSTGLSLSGWFEDRLAGLHAASDIEQEYLEYLSNNREIINDKMTIDGAHKSDFGMFNKTLELPVNITSTGQQKSALLSWIIAHAKLIHAKSAKYPIILLDEAAAHLDTDARAALFRELSATSAQVWATGIDESMFKDVNDALFVSCNDGMVFYKV